MLAWFEYDDNSVTIQSFGAKNAFKVLKQAVKWRGVNWARKLEEEDVNDEEG